LGSEFKEFKTNIVDKIENIENKQKKQLDGIKIILEKGGPRMGGKANNLNLTKFFLIIR
jgi:hypothetical protein